MTIRRMCEKTEVRLADFEFWKGAKRYADHLTSTEFDKIETTLERVFPEGLYPTELNDLFWFDADVILSLIGETKDSVLSRE